MIFLKNIIKWTRSRCKLTSFIILTVVLLIVYLIQMCYFNSYLTMKMGKPGYHSNDEEKDVNFSNIHFSGEKLVHFDLKGAPPKISYLLNLLPFLKKLGATGILLEYEDTFPYHSGLEEITAFNAYTPSDIAAIVQTAEVNNLTVIPLIPTFGHFEFVLKHQRFREFREVDESPDVLCPSQENVYPLLKKMIDQMLEAHNTSKYLHIGCDEVEFLGMCSKCQKMMKTKKWRKDSIYFNHVKKIAQYIVTTHPDIRPIVWSDKFLKENEKIISRYEIQKFVDVMFWNYRPEKHNYPHSDDMQSFAKLFKNLWIANAFKGATGSTQIVTNVDYHARNTKGWMVFYEEWKSKLNFKGITLTGWQRYNHFMALCELLPVGIPSLALNLQLLSHPEVLDENEIKQTLKCNKCVPITLHEIENIMLLSRLKCDFPGFKIYRKIHSYYIVLLHLKAALRRLERGDYTFYNILHNASNPSFIQQLSKTNYKRQLVQLDVLEDELRVALSAVYDQYTVNEWIITHVKPVQLRLQAAINMINSLSRLRVWPRRPFANNGLRAKEIFNKICGNNETTGCTFFNIHL